MQAIYLECFLVAHMKIGFNQRTDDGTKHTVIIHEKKKNKRRKNYLKIHNLIHFVSSQHVHNV